MIYNILQKSHKKITRECAYKTGRTLYKLFVLEKTHYTILYHIGDRTDWIIIYPTTKET